MTKTDLTQSVSEELNLMGFSSTTTSDNVIVMDTIAGKLHYTVSEKTVMGDVYRIISHYGSKLHNWGLQNKIKESGAVVTKIKP